MKKLIFCGKAACADKAPLFCREEIALGVKDVKFKNYPLSLLCVGIGERGITADGAEYLWEDFHVTVHKVGRHITKCRETVEENIVITVDIQ
ncbi:MAG: hypothetical protein IJW21_03195 [Clostridia bacterium]|nr:hypothetical protein [Clostridia bacterium]